MAESGSGSSYTDIILRHCVVEHAVNGVDMRMLAAAANARGSLTAEDTSVRSCSEMGIRLVALGSGMSIHYSGLIVLSLSRCQVFSNALSGLYCEAKKVAGWGEIPGTIRNSGIFRNGAHGIQIVSPAAESIPDVINNIVWGNTGDGLRAEAMKKQFKNNIIVGNGLGIIGTRIEGSPVVTFNNVWGNATNWAGVAAAFESAPGNISVDPLFTDPAAGDFHLRSQAGRYDPATDAWVRDAVTSPCIDAGDPASAFANEPQPNGGRINLGAFGGTPFASKSVPRLTGVLDPSTQDFVLSWHCQPGETYQVLYSATPDGPWWDDLPDSQLTAGANQTILSYTNTSVSLGMDRLYRVRWNLP